MLLLLRPPLFPLFADEKLTSAPKRRKKIRKLFARRDDKVPLVADPDVAGAVERMMAKFSGAVEKVKFELARKRESDDQEIAAILELLWD